jgi:hypothetical protein
VPKLELFFLLKLVYRQGKFKYDSSSVSFLALVECKTDKAIKEQLKHLIEIGWIYENKRTGYHIIKSFDRIRKENNWNVRLSFKINFYNYYKINAVTGAVVYGYLHKDFWRMVKKEKSVQLKGSTYNFRKFNFNYKDKPAPVSVIGVEQIFDITRSTASRIKRAAKEEGLLSVKKNYSKVEKNIDVNKIRKYNDVNNIVRRKGKYYYQEIDTVCPLFEFSKRKSLQT